MLGEKRMFSRKVVESDAFLDMSFGAQTLYFHLCMNADDEGFISAPKRIMRMVGLEESALEELINKKFILTFTSGVVVIKHWRINNTLRKDRCQPTGYTEEREQLSLKENGSYTFDLSVGNHLSTTWQPDDGIKEKKRKEKNVKEKKIKESAEGDFFDFQKLLRDISDRANGEGHELQKV